MATTAAPKTSPHSAKPRLEVRSIALATIDTGSRSDSEPVSHLTILVVEIPGAAGVSKRSPHS
jgi:hypothetical protein